MASGFETATGTVKRERKQESKRDELVYKRTLLVVIVMAHVTYIVSLYRDDLVTRSCQCGIVDACSAQALLKSTRIETDFAP